MPLIAGMKEDIGLLHANGLDWDGRIPDNLKKIWDSNFELMKEIGSVRYNRAIVLVNSKNINIEIIGTGDASQKMISAAI